MTALPAVDRARAWYSARMATQRMITRTLLDVAGRKADIAVAASLGPVGVDIFCREAQQVWVELRPYLDRKALAGLIRVDLDDRLADRVRDEVRASG